MPASPPAPLLGVASGDIEFVVAVRAYDMGDTDDDAGATGFARMGFDLDDTCTGPSGPASSPTVEVASGRFEPAKVDLW